MSNWTSFEPSKHYIINSSTPSAQYRSRKDEVKTTVHWGQRKLFLTVLQFMTLYVDVGVGKTPKIVYAGAAPGHNIALLSKLFPTCEFHLYDMNPFSKLLNDNPKIKLYKQLFLDDDAKKWTEVGETYLISDIRRDTAGMDTKNAEIVIQGDMEMQKKWYEIMKPKYAHFKFHLPYSGLGLGVSTEYLNGTVYVQPWRGPSSTECRLVPKWGEKKIWNNKLYEDQNFYINTVLREGTRFTNPLTGTNTPIDGEELQNDYDSAMEINILMDYLKKFSPNPHEDIKYVVNLSHILTKTITFNMSQINSEVYLKHLRKDIHLLAPKTSIFKEYSEVEE